MPKSPAKYLILAFIYLAVFIPLGIAIANRTWGFDSTLLPNLFPFFGLAAVALLWLHSMAGVFEPWLRTRIDFDKYVHATSIIIFFCIVLHPFLFLLGIGFNFSDVFSYGTANYIRLGIVGWFLLITYDIGKALKKHGFFVRHWNKILIVSTIGFLLTFFHSLGIGGDLQSGPLRILWSFYGTTAVLATMYTYGIKRFLKR